MFLKIYLNWLTLQGEKKISKKGIFGSKINQNMFFMSLTDTEYDPK